MHCRHVTFKHPIQDVSFVSISEDKKHAQMIISDSRLGEINCYVFDVSV